MRSLRLDEVRNEIFTTERNGTRVTAVGVDAVQAALLHGHDQPPQSPEGSLATPAAKSATSA